MKGETSLLKGERTSCFYEFLQVRNGAGEGNIDYHFSSDRSATKLKRHLRESVFGSNDNIPNLNLVSIGLPPPDPTTTWYWGWQYLDWLPNYHNIVQVTDSNAATAAIANEIQSREDRIQTLADENEKLKRKYNRLLAAGDSYTDELKRLKEE